MAGCTPSSPGSDRIAPLDVVPTDEEGVQLLGSMVAYAGTYTLGDKQVIHHIDISWNQGWTGTDQVRFFELDGDTLTITTAPYRSYQDGRKADRSWSGTRYRRVTRDWQRGNRMADLFGLSGAARAGDRGVQRARPAFRRRARRRRRNGSPSRPAARRRWRRPWSRSAHRRAGAKCAHGRDGRRQCRAGLRRRPKRSSVRSAS